MTLRMIETDSQYLAEFHADKQRVWVYLRKHPALLLSGCYFYFSFVGLTYLWLLHQRFGVSIVSYLDVIDFALAFLATASIYLPILVFLLLSHYLAKVALRFSANKIKPASSSVQSSWRLFYGVRLYSIVAVFVVGVSCLYAVQSAVLKANSIKDQTKYLHAVDLNYPVQLANQQKVMQLRGALISVTSRFLFILPKGQGYPLAIPISNVSAVQRIEPQAASQAQSNASVAPVQQTTPGVPGIPPKAQTTALKLQ